MTLVFVYNANSGRLNALFDIGHKIVSPDTYRCGLCRITHGTFAEHTVWREFRESSDWDLRFLHKDEFETEFATSYDYPVVLEQGAALGVFISNEELSAMTGPEELIALIGRRVGEARNKR